MHTRRTLMSSRTLVREITCILLIKLLLLWGIKTLWFDAPTVPRDGASRTAARLLDAPTPPSASPQPSTEVSPR